MKLAHLSDLHLMDNKCLSFRALLGRRFFGAINYFATRANAFSVEVAKKAVETVLQQGVDHCVVTGDVSNLALDLEFALAKEVLRPLWSYERLTVVPGNHDLYTPESARSRVFDHYFAPTLWKEGVGAWPVIKEVYGVVLVGLRSAAPAPPMCAFGRIGKDQLKALEEALRRASSANLPVIVVMHHNPYRRGPIAEATGRLLDRDPLKALLASYRPTLVLHGHDHTHHRMVITANASDRGTPVIGCGASGSAKGQGGVIMIYHIGSGLERIEEWRFRKETAKFEKMGG